MRTCYCHLATTPIFPCRVPVAGARRRQKKSGALPKFCLTRGTAKNLTRNMNMKARRVDTTQRTIVLGLLYLEKISGLSCEASYAVAYVPPLAHTRVLGGFSVALRSQGEVRRTPYFFLLPFPVSTVARLTTRRYVKEQIPQFPTECSALYHNRMPSVNLEFTHFLARLDRRAKKTRQPPAVFR